MSIRGWADAFSPDGAVIRWAYFGESPSSFIVYRAEAEDGPWNKIGAVAADAWGILDPLPRLYAMLRQTWYKVVVSLDTGDEESLAFRADGGIPKRDLLMGREMIRQSRLERIKGNGVRGSLFRLRRWGKLCRSCGSSQVGGATSGTCRECFGTGFTGGFYSPLDCWIKLERGSQSRMQQEDGFDEAEAVQASFVGWPLPEPGDLWRSSSDGATYQIASGGDPLQRAVSIRELPISVIVAMSRLSASNPLSHLGFAPTASTTVVKAPHGPVDTVIPADTVVAPEQITKRKVYDV